MDGSHLSQAPGPGAAYQDPKHPQVKPKDHPMPRIYVSSLSDYNAGILHGTWIDLEQFSTPEEVHEQIQAMLCESKHPNITVKCPDCVGTGIYLNHACGRCEGHGKWEQAEEYAIHDHEGFPAGVILEHPDLEEVCAWADLLAEHDIDLVEAAIECADRNAGPEDIQAKIEDDYCGKADSLADWAQEYCEECGLIPKGLPKWIAYHIDWESVANNELMLSGDFTHARVNGTEYIFRNN